MTTLQDFAIDLFGDADIMWDVGIGVLAIILIVGIVKVIVTVSDASL